MSSVGELRECRAADLDTQIHYGSFPRANAFRPMAMCPPRWFTEPAGGFWTFDFGDGDGPVLRYLRASRWQSLVATVPQADLVAHEADWSRRIVEQWSLYLTAPPPEARVLVLDDESDLRAVAARYPYIDEQLVARIEALAIRARRGDYGGDEQPEPPNTDDDALIVRLLSKWHSVVLAEGDLRPLCGEVDWPAVAAAGFGGVHLTERGHAVLNATWQIPTAKRWGRAVTLWLRWLFSYPPVWVGTALDPAERLNARAAATVRLIERLRDESLKGRAS
ncbi:MAG TPA: hypothetical protein VIU62_10960 [Chloroflexota bacterium]